MTDIDPGAEISIGRCYDVDQDHERDHLVVRIPLAERVDQDWIRWYQRLARVKGISARRRSSGGKQRQDRCSRLRCARSHPRVAGYRTGLVQGSQRGAGEAAADRRSRVTSSACGGPSRDAEGRRPAGVRHGVRAIEQGMILGRMVVPTGPTPWSQTVPPCRHP